jgi:hypothetical protein
LQLIEPALSFNLPGEALLTFRTARFLPAGDPVTVARVLSDVCYRAPPETAANP